MFRFSTNSGFLILLILFLSQACSNKETLSQSLDRLDDVSIIPYPQKIYSGADYFELHSGVNIKSDPSNPDVGQLNTYLNDEIKSRTGYTLSNNATGTDQAAIHLYIKNIESANPEAYEIEITSEQVYISARTEEGLFRGIQTILQVIDNYAYTELEIPSGEIIDQPQYEYRGTMLDVSRHFFGVDYLKRYIDILAYYKINYLHLHLSDDQGWRIEIKSWPLLTEIGGSTDVGGGPGGFYTQEDFKEIVEYAAERYITIVPEIDMPGHSNAATASYPILNGNGKTPELYTGKKVGFSTFDTRGDTVYQFIDDVIREISAISPAPYFHIGGDERHVTEDEDYIYFINRVEKIVQKYGKQMIGWTEVAQADLDSTSIAQYWVHEKKAEMAMNKNMRMILSPAERTYLDMKYDSLSPFGYNWIGYISVEHAYDWNPEDYFPGAKIMGIEAPLWSENFSTLDSLELMAFPRLIGIAELGWTKTELRDWNSYKVRLANQAYYLRRNGINFYESPSVNWPNH